MFIYVYVYIYKYTYIYMYIYMTHCMGVWADIANTANPLALRTHPSLGTERAPAMGGRRVSPNPGWLHEPFPRRASPRLGVVWFW